MNKKLAIKGHPTRNKEVIELLEMMGGKNFYEYDGKCVVDIELLYFFIADDNFIRYGSSFFNDNFVIFTLEEFLEKNPFKVGDFVNIPEYESEVRICKMKWCEFGYIEYLVYRNDDEEWYTANELMEYNAEFLFDKEYGENDGEMLKNITTNHIYKEETMEVTETLVEIDLTREKSKAEEIEVILGDYEFVLKNGKTYFVKKKPQYPKTYKDCCEVLMGKTDFQDFELVLTKLAINRNEENCISPEPPKIALINNFYKLLICRDSYWKIAGIEIGLGKPWGINYGCGEWGYWIGYDVNANKIYCQDSRILLNNLLVFPTKEMRDAFYENFKELIETVKELL